MPDLVLDYHRLKTPIDHPDASVVTAKIADGAVTTAKIADLAVATAKIADLAVTTAKIADGAVTTAKIADGAVTTAKLATLDYATFTSLTADPALAAGRLFFRRDLGLLSYSPDGTTVRRIPYGTINVDAHASRHAAGGADPIPTGGISRSMLEYPTVNVSFAYLTATNKVLYANLSGGPVVITRDAFADKAVLAILQTYPVAYVYTRLTTRPDWYRTIVFTGASTADHALQKYYNYTTTTLATEAVDLSASGMGFAPSCSGSTIKSLRYALPVGFDPLAPPTPTATLSATDTSIVSGLFGYNTLMGGSNASGPDSGTGWLLSPLSALPPALAILETEVGGSGSLDDPFRPSLAESLVEISQMAGLPSFLYLEAKRYETLRSKGFTDEEIGALLGYVPQHQVDLDAVTWGAFELHADKAQTAIVIVTGDNPYKRGAIQRQAEFARKKGLRVFDPPRNYGEAVALYSKLKGDFPHWLAGKDNFAYMCLGWEELDVFQCVDFYYGELIEHRTHYDQLRRVDPKEIENRLLELKARLEGVKVLPEERGKHLRKVEELLKRGW